MPVCRTAHRVHTPAATDASRSRAAGAATATRTAAWPGLDRRRAGHTGPDGLSHPAPPPGAAAPRVRPADRGGDPGQQDHDPALRTSRTRRPDPHRRQEGRSNPRRRWLASSRTQRRGPRARHRLRLRPRCRRRPHPTRLRRGSQRRDRPHLCHLRPASCAVLPQPRHPVREVITDNARNYTVSLDFQSRYRRDRRTPLDHPPHCPWQNGKVERFNRTIQIEWAYRQVFFSNTERTQALDPWLDYYNTQRRHSAIGGLPPISRLS